MFDTKKSDRAMLGTGMKFDLRAVPYSAKNSHLCFFEDPDERCLYLSVSRSPNLMMERKNLIRLAPVLDSNEIPFEYEVEPEKLTIKTFRGTIEVSFASEKQMRVRGKGAGLRLGFKTIMFENMSPKEDGAMEMAYSIIGKLLFVPLKGGLYSGAKWIPEKAMVEAFNMELLPSADTGEFETAIHEYYSNGMRDREYASFDDCVKATRENFENFLGNFPKAANEYAGMARLAAWTIWTHTMPAGGYLKNQTVFMGKLSFLRAFSWQQSYQAMALRSNTKEAWKLLLSMFEYQDAAGQLPDSVGETGASYRVSKPVIQGLAIDYLLNNGDMSGIGKEDYKKMYEGLSRFTSWWLTKRDHQGNGIPKYYHPDESGWDDATIFKKGTPLMSGDLLAWIILAAEACGKIAEKAGAGGEAAKWEAESKRLLEILVKDFWNGKQFTGRVAETGEIVVQGSVAALQPIILGKRLPQEIIDTIAKRLEDEGEFMTAGGIVSEKLGSPEFTIRRGFMRGNIVAPVQLLLAMGLKNAGKEELARKIASRYCGLVKEKGLALMLSPWDFDPATGITLKKQDIYDPNDWDKGPELFKKEIKESETVEPWTSWAAACYIALVDLALG